MKSSYNEHFSFSDPLAKTSACRVTRHRAKKLKENHVAGGGSHVQYRCSAETAPHYGVSSDEVEDEILPIPCATKSSQSNIIVPTSLDPNTSIDYDVCNVACEELSNHPQSLEFSDLVTNTPVPEHTDLEDDEGDDDDELASDNEASSNESKVQYELLYKEALITTSASSVLIMKYAIKHKLSGEALADLLQILKLYCPSPNNTPSSLFRFKKQFNDYKYPVKHHYFCNACLSEVPENAEFCSNQDCN